MRLTSADVAAPIVENTPELIDDPRFAESGNRRSRRAEVIAELDASDPRIEPIMEDVRKAQPAARRIVRGAGRGEGDLVHRYVDRDSGLEALLDAVTANIGV